MKFFETLLSGLKAIILSHSYSKVDSDEKYLTKDKQAQPDWNESNKKSPAFIKNKPEVSNVGKEGTGEGAEVFNDYNNNRASGDYSHAEGCMTNAYGEYSHTEGFATSASAYSHAEGNQTEATGNFSHAEGDQTDALGECSHSEGFGTRAIGYTSHTEGSVTKARGNMSHAEGFNTEATSSSQHVQGEYNIVDYSERTNERGRYAHIVGNGTSDSVRSNAHTLDWDGNAWFAGDVYIGGTSQDDAKKLLTPDEYSIPIKDSVTGVRYVIMMKNGQIISRSATKSIEVITMPAASTIEGGYLDMTGMVVNATLESGEVITIDNSLLDKVVVTDSIVKITYYEAGYRFVDEIEINMIPIEEALIDFTYTIQDDGTYYLTGWKGTLNGVTSDTLVVPNSTLIVL